MRGKNKTLSSEMGVGGIHEVADKDITKTYFYVSVGQMNVVIPEQLNLTTMEGMTLIKERASMIDNEGLATNIAEEVGGKVFRIQETYTRLSIEVAKWETLEDTVI